MSLQSMTGFGSYEVSNQDYKVLIEVKSVNHRFKDMRFKMSSSFNSLELELKGILDNMFKRGSFETHIQFRKNESLKNDLEVDLDKVKSYINQIKKITDQSDITLNVQPTEFLRNDFYQDQTYKQEEIKELIIACFIKACEKLQSSRVDEGSKLIDKLKQHQKAFLNSFLIVQSLKDSYQSEIKNKLISLIKKEEIAIDEQRLQQEIIYYLEKLDIEEEISRIQVHLEKLSQILEQTSECGREIDFIVQELNRETNTIGSKCANDKISENVVQMKVQLEKIREQALNLE